jgi:dolichol-phosphate mannosyltransferase
MDADLQHDEALLAPMLSLLRAGEADLVVGSRYIAEGGVGAWGKRRQSVSVLATRLSRLVLKERVLGDPMSGFFMLTRAAYDQAVRKLSIQGYKILLDIVASSPVNLRVRELPYVFGVRQHGASKLDSVVVLDYLTLLLDKLVGRWVPARFLLFTTVGAFGLAVHFAILALALLLAFPFIVSQSLAAVIAMTGNFFINNVLTYRDKRIRGFAPLLLGLLGFCAVCSVGAVANVGIANFMFARNYSWWLSGLCGVMVGAVWNYAASSVVTWRR